MSMPGVNTWQVDLQTVDLVPGTATYSVPANTLEVIPAGIVHHDQNGGSSVMSFSQLVIPEPEAGMPFGVHVQIDKSQERTRR